MGGTHTYTLNTYTFNNSFHKICSSSVSVSLSLSLSNNRPLKLHCSNDDLSSAVVDIILATVPVIHDRSHEEQEVEAEVEPEMRADIDAHPDRSGDHGDGNYNAGDDTDGVHRSAARRNHYAPEPEPEPEPEYDSQRDQYDEEQIEKNSSSSRSVQIPDKGMYEYCILPNV